MEEIKISEKKASEVRAALLSWYDSHRRELPWRQEPTPYHVWISEIMLQQTRVEAVKGYYERFLAQFPDVRSLAESDEDSCLKLWEGLGYYSRARNLRRAASEILAAYGGQMPDTAAELRRLPGIGPYTAAAIASIAFGEKIPAIDGNLLRVFARLTCYEEEIRTSAAWKQAEAYYLRVMPEDRPGDFNQAVMDLSSMVCMPREGAVCLKDPAACPLSRHCAAFSRGKTAALPVMPAKKARKTEKKTILVIWCSDRVLLRRRPLRGMLAGMWEFPNETGWLSEQEAVAAARSLGFEPVQIRPLPESRHIFTHREWLMRGYEIRTGSFSENTDADEEADVPETGICILADVCELRNRYAIPGAYAAYLPI